MHDNDWLELRKQMSLESFANSRSRMKVPDVGRNLVPDILTADGEGELPELGPCPHDKSWVGCIEERSWRRLDSFLWNMTMLLR